MPVRRNTEEWLELYNEQRNSGQLMKEWCQENNININTMTDKICRLRKAGIIKERALRSNSVRKTKVAKDENKEYSLPAWVRVETPSPLTLVRTAKKPELWIETGIFRINLSPGFCEETLLSACKVLMRLC